MINCDCHERIGIEINSYQLLLELKTFFEEQVKKGLFLELPVVEPYFQGYNLPPDKVKDEYKWYADKWYKCKNVAHCGKLNIRIFQQRGL